MEDMSKRQRSAFRGLGYILYFLRLLSDKSVDLRYTVGRRLEILDARREASNPREYTLGLEQVEYQIIKCECQAEFGSKRQK